MVLDDPYERLPPPKGCNTQIENLWSRNTVAIILCGGRGCVQSQQE